MTPAAKKPASPTTARAAPAFPAAMAARENSADHPDPVDFEPSWPHPAPTASPLRTPPVAANPIETCTLLKNSRCSTLSRTIFGAGPCRPGRTQGPLRAFGTTGATRPGSELRCRAQITYPDSSVRSGPCPTLAWACRATANGSIQRTDMPTQAWDMAPVTCVNDAQIGRVIFARLLNGPR